MASEAETLLLPGAVGYRGPGISSQATPGAVTVMDLDNGDELGGEDDESTVPGSPIEIEGGIGDIFGGDIAAEVIDPEPAVPGPGTPELGNPDSPKNTREQDIPVPAVLHSVPVFDLSQADRVETTFHDSPPPPPPPISITAAGHDTSENPTPPLKPVAPKKNLPALNIARHTQALELSGSALRMAGTTGLPFVANDGQPAGLPRKSVEAALSSSETEKPEAKKPKLDYLAPDELSDATMESGENPRETGDVAESRREAPHPYTPLRSTRGPRINQGPSWIEALQQIHSSLQDLHTKADGNKDGQDKLHAEVVGIRSELGQQDIRISSVESTCHEHTNLHKSTMQRVNELEQQVKKLHDRDRDRERSPTPPRRGRSGERGPSPHLLTGLHVALGGIEILTKTSRLLSGDGSKLENLTWNMR